MVKLGDRVKDQITGFTGIATGRYEYLYGCVRVSVQAEKLKDGKVADGLVFYEDQLEVIKAGAVTGVAAKSKPTTGGPRSFSEERNERR
jgi:hypothetical protein